MRRRVREVDVSGRRFPVGSIWECTKEFNPYVVDNPWSVYKRAPRARTGEKFLLLKLPPKDTVHDLRCVLLRNDGTSVEAAMRWFSESESNLFRRIA